MSDTITVRASSMPGLFDCAYGWEGRQILKLQSPYSRRAVVGVAIHAGTAAFDGARMKGNPIKPADATDVVMAKLKDPGVDMRPELEDLTSKEAEVIALTLLSRYCTEISPRYKFLAVEMNVGQLDIAVGNVTVRLTGNLDRTRLVEESGSTLPRVADLKSGGKAASKDRATGRIKAEIKGHGLQIGVYQIVHEQVLKQEVDTVGEVIGLCTGSTAHIGVTEIKSPKLQILGRGDGTPSLLEHAANMLKTGLFPPNPRSNLCSPKYCPRWSTCSYHE